MMDMLPFLNVLGQTPDDKITDIINYLIQFKETLEFALMNISTDNLSPELINRLNELGANIEKSNQDREEEIAQVSAINSISITVADVCNSDLFKNELKSKIMNLNFSVNFENGNLEYDIAEGGGS